MTLEYDATDLNFGGWELRVPRDNAAPPCLYCRGHYVEFDADGGLSIDMSGERDYFEVPGAVMNELVSAYSKYMAALR